MKMAGHTNSGWPNRLHSVLLFLAGFGAVYYAFALLQLGQAFGEDGLSMGLVNRDFANVWMGARLWIEQSVTDLFVQDAYMARLQQVFCPDYPLHAWSYPPHALLLIWPFGFFEYRSGLLIYWLAGLVAFVFAVLELRRSTNTTGDRGLLIAAATAFALLAIETTQNGLYTAAMLLLGFAWSRSRVVLAALAFALLTTKPQLGILLPLWMLADRNWRLIAWTSGLTIALVALSIALVGVEAWSGFLERTLPNQRLVMSDWYGVFLPMMATVFGAGRVLGLEATTAYMLHWPVAAASFALFGYLVWRLRDAGLRFVSVMSATFLISPYAFNYDMGALVVLAALAAGDSGNGLTWQLRCLLGLTAVLPPLILRLGLSGLPVTPLILFATIVGLAWFAFKEHRESADMPLPAT